jgi:geranylgeranyl reductase family protein
MQHYDAIVIGAGPAGNAAAFDLARAGAKVALLEKQPLPRHKTCGGGMPMTVAHVLALDEGRDLPPDTFVEADTRFMRHTYHFDDAYLAAMNPDEETAGPLSLWMVRRSVFDNALAQRAARAGTELRDDLPLRCVEVEGNRRVRVQAEGRHGAWEATAETLIGADGANGIVARSFGLRRDRALAIAIEAEVPHTWGEGHPDLRRDVCHLEYGAVRRGYAWVFPKDDHLNVGAGVFRPRASEAFSRHSVREELHKAILDYLTLLGVPRRSDELDYHAHPLPIWNGLEPLQTRDNRVLLAGDAAGLINPCFGDGILHALKSGRIAARAIIAHDTAGYTSAIAAEFRADFDAALKFAKFFYQWPGLCYRHGVKRPTATRTATRLLAGELPFKDITGRVVRRLREAMRGEPDTEEAALPQPR